MQKIGLVAISSRSKVILCTQTKDLKVEIKERVLNTCPLLQYKKYDNLNQCSWGSNLPLSSCCLTHYQSFAMESNLQR